MLLLEAADLAGKTMTKWILLQEWVEMIYVCFDMFRLLYKHYCTIVTGSILSLLVLQPLSWAAQFSEELCQKCHLFDEANRLLAVAVS